MKVFLFLSALLVESIVFVGFLVGIFLSSSTIYYLYYIQALCFLALIFWLYKNPRFTIEANCLNNKKYSKGLLAYILKITIYWTLFIFVSLWIFSNLTKFSMLYNNTVNVSFQDVAIILKNNSISITILPVILVSILIFAFSHFIFIKEKSSLWQYVIIEKIQNKKTLFINRMVGLIIEVAKFFIFIFLTSMFCIVWLEYLAIFLGMDNPLSNYLALGSISFFVASFIFFLSHFFIKKLNTFKLSLGFYISLAIALTLILNLLVFYFLSKTGVVELLSKFGDSFNYIHVFNFINFKLESRFLVMLMGWFVITAPDFSGLITKESENRTSIEIFLINLFICLTLFLSIKFLDINNLAVLISYFSNTYSNVIASLIVLSYIYFLYFKVYSYGDYLRGFIPDNGRKLKVKHLSELLPRLLPNIPLYVGMIIFFGWPMTQFLLTGAAFFIAPFLLLFVVFALNFETKPEVLDAS